MTPMEWVDLPKGLSTAKSEVQPQLGYWAGERAPGFAANRQQSVLKHVGRWSGVLYCEQF